MRNFAEYPKNIYSGLWKYGHCQGIAVDTEKEFIYYSFTTALVKTDLEGNLIGSCIGLLGHLGCIQFNKKDGRVYGSLEYKNDIIGRNILKNLGSDYTITDGFYIVMFDVDKIDRVDMDACSDGVMTSVYLKEVVDDFSAEVVQGGKTLKHRHGCSGIDGTTFGRIPGSTDDKEYLFVTYGVYGDNERTDNDYQVILCYDTENWGTYEKPLNQDNMHTCGPEAPYKKFFVYTGNTTWGVQNLEFDRSTGNFLMAVYLGKKPQFPNLPMYIVDGSVAPKTEKLAGYDPEMTGEVLSLLPNGTDCKTPGWTFPHGSTGLCHLGGEWYYVSCHGRTEENQHYTNVKLCRWNGKDPLEIIDDKPVGEHTECTAYLKES